MEIDLTYETGRLALATQLFHRFAEDVGTDPNKARIRLISGIQIAIRDALEGGKTHSLYKDAPLRIEPEA